MNANNIISINHLINNGLREYLNYKDMFLMCKVKDLNLFRFPCHLKATTILVCLDGELSVTVNLKDYTITKHSILINFPKNIIHINKVNNLDAFAILISTEFMHSLSLDILSQAHFLSHEISKNGMFTLPKNEMTHLSYYLAIIRNLLSSSTHTLNEELFKHVVAAFITNVVILHHYYYSEQIDKPSSLKGHTIIMDRFIELLRMYHSRERVLRFYADKMCITPKYLSNVVRKASGKKATDWISDFVILEAKSLLMYSGQNIQEVSRQLNFPTQSAFGKYFKCQVGMSPSEFIKHNQTF